MTVAELGPQEATIRIANELKLSREDVVRLIEEDKGKQASARPPQ